MLKKSLVLNFYKSLLLKLPVSYETIHKHKCFHSFNIFPFQTVYSNKEEIRKVV